MDRSNSSRHREPKERPTGPSPTEPPLTQPEAKGAPGRQRRAQAKIVSAMRAWTDKMTHPHTPPSLESGDMPYRSRPRRRHPNWPLRWLLLGSALAMLLYVAGPLWLADQASDARPFSLRSVDSLQTRLLTLVVCSWFLFLGASFGSFLNVMAWRLPRNGTLNGSSYCPYCAQPIAFYDNVPILGWIALRGRCRKCHLPISPRYILVELFTAAVFFGLFVIEFLSGGANLPQFTPAPSWGSLWVSFRPPPELLAVYAHHALWLTALITASLIEWDGLFQPPKLYLCMALFAACLAAVFPRVIPPAGWPPGWERLLPSALGLLAGAGFGVLAAWCYGQAKSPRRDATDPSYLLLYAMSGAFLGWRGLSAVVLMTAGLDVMLAGLRRVVHSFFGGASVAPAPWPHAWSLLAMGFLFVSLWRSLDPYLTSPSAVTAFVLALPLHWASGRLDFARSGRLGKPVSQPLYDQPTPAEQHLRMRVR